MAGESERLPDALGEQPRSVGQRAAPMVPAARRRHAAHRSGQVLVLFVLFLLVLLGISALAIDYATWLLTDRYLQNVSDHAALAGASQFDDIEGTCSGGAGQPKCVAARVLAWTSLNDQLELGLSAAAIAALAANDSPAGGQPDGSYGGQAVTFTDVIWVTTPPPSYAAYVDPGGRYALNFGIVFVRVDRAVRSFLGGVLGIEPDPRAGWATAGALPTDFALQIFCRNAIPPEDGACGGTGQAGLVIDGQGGIRLLRGDIASNESIKVTAQSGSGVILEAGNAFVVQGECSASSWNCPQVPATTGGLADADPIVYPATANNKNAFYMAPLPVPHYESPLDFASVSNRDCVGASETSPCVPYMPSGSVQPGAWSCSTIDLNNLCGVPVADTVAGTVSCIAAPSALSPSRHLVPWSDGSGANGFGELPDQANNEDYKVIDDDSTVPDPDTTATDPPTDYVYMNGTLGTSGGSATQNVTYNLRPPFGIPQPGQPTDVSYVAFKTDGSSALSNDGNEISVSATLLQSGTPVPSGTEPADAHILTGTPQLFTFTVSPGQITNYTALSLRFTFHTTVDNGTRRGGGVAWAEAFVPDLNPALPAMIPPGYYESIYVPDDGCAILDPTGTYFGLRQYQLPGIYRMDGGGNAKVGVGGDGDGDGVGAFLIGDGVTFVFDPDFPDSSGNASSGRGIVVDPGGALVLNTSREPGFPPCTPTESETATYNPSDPLTALPYSSVCAGWAVDSGQTTGVRDGLPTWPVCIDPLANPCVARSQYETPATPSSYRGITFYFTPDPGWSTAHADMNIRNRFQMGGGSGTQPGIAFRGVLYAPYDNVKISGGNGFSTVGQVLAWTAKFNGGGAYIYLDYPYAHIPAPPYLLEPTIAR